MVKSQSMTKSQIFLDSVLARFWSHFCNIFTPETSHESYYLPNLVQSTSRLCKYRSEILKSRIYEKLMFKRNSQNVITRKKTADFHHKAIITFIGNLHILAVNIITDDY